MLPSDGAKTERTFDEEGSALVHWRVVVERADPTGSVQRAASSLTSSMKAAEWVGSLV